MPPFLFFSPRRRTPFLTKRTLHLTIFILDSWEESKTYVVKYYILTIEKGGRRVGEGEGERGRESDVEIGAGTGEGEYVW